MSNLASNPVSISILPFLLVFLFGCAAVEPQINVAPIEEVLGTAAPLAWAAAQTMDAVDGYTVPCAQVVAPGTVHVEVGPGCALPVADVGSGIAVVSGVWHSPELAVLVGGFGDIEVGTGQQLFVVGVAAMTVTRTDDNELTVAYVEQDIEASSGAESRAAVEQSAWVVQVQNDELAISGARQVAVAGRSSNVTQVAVANAVMDPSCRRNPVAGIATLQDVSAGADSVSAEVVTIRFHERCDGRADVLIGPGLSVQLDLLD